MERSSLIKNIMKISLIIPAYNEEKYIENCLSSIEKHGKDLFEVIVINNASTDNTPEIVKRFPNVRLIHEPRKGLPFARNKGLSEAKGDIVAFIDADTKMPKGWVNKIIKEFNKNDKIVSISGPYIYYDISMFKKSLIWIYWILLGWPSYLITRYMIVIGNFAVKKSEIDKLGGFNENILFYGDDTDIAKKLHKVGKVKFSQKFYMFTSARRLNHEGILLSAYKYIINFLWIVFKDKPKTTTYKNIR